MTEVQTNNTGPSATVQTCYLLEESIEWDEKRLADLDNCIKALGGFEMTECIDGCLHNLDDESEELKEKIERNKAALETLGGN